MESTNDAEVIDDGQSFLDTELEALKSIYVNEINVDQDADFTTVSIKLFPATADKLDEQYVRMTLDFLLSSDYPETIPKIQIRNPRGLSEEKLECIKKELLSISESKKGSSMLFEMIEAAKEHLTTGNRPCEECGICLYGFSETDVFTKTECFHYFHSHCLARYAKSFKESASDKEDSNSVTGSNLKQETSELVCPMCRVPIQFSGDEEDFPPPDENDESSFELNEEMLELQEKMAELFKKQLDQGGIIDVEAEKNKFLLEISQVPTIVSSAASQEPKISELETVDNSSKNVSVLEGESHAKVDCLKKDDGKTQKEEKDVRSKNQSYRKQGERGRNSGKWDRNYNRPSYNNNSRGYNYRNKGNDYHDRFSHKKYSRDSVAPRHLEGEENEKAESATDAENLEATRTVSAGDETAAVLEDQAAENRYRPKYSPRRSRGPRRGNYNRYEGRDKPSRPGYPRNQSSNACDLDTAEIDEAKDPEDGGDRKKASYGENKRSRGPRRGNYNRYDNRYEGRGKPDRRDSFRNQNSNESDRDVEVQNEEKNIEGGGDSERTLYEENKRNRGPRRGSYNRYNRVKSDQQNYFRKQNSNESDRDFEVHNEEKDFEGGDDRERTSHEGSKRNRGSRRGSYNQYESRVKSERQEKQNSNESAGDAATHDGEKDTGEDGERMLYEGSKRNSYRNNRPRFEQDGERPYYNRNPQRGGRSYNRPNGYYNDHKPFGRDRYQKSAQNPPNSDERNRSFPERENYRGNRFNNYSDGPGLVNSKSSSRNNRSTYAEESVNIPQESGDLESHNSSTRPQCSSNVVSAKNEEVVASVCSNKSSVSESNASCEKNLPSFSEAQEKNRAKNGIANPPVVKENLGSLTTGVNPPPGFANPMKKVIYGLKSANPPPGFNRS